MKKSINAFAIILALFAGYAAQAQTDKEGTNLSTGNGTNKNGNGSIVPNTPNTGTDNTPTGGYQNSAGHTVGEKNTRDYENTNTQTPNVVGSQTPPEDNKLNSDTIRNANMDNRQDKYISSDNGNTGKAATKTNSTSAKTSKKAKHTNSTKKGSK